jgi:hypothetical protein
MLAAAGDGAVYRLVRGDTRGRRADARIGSDAVHSLLALAQHGVVLAGSDRGIFRSSDGGRSWVLVEPAADGAVVSFARDPTIVPLFFKKSLRLVPPTGSANTPSLS